MTTGWKILAAVLLAGAAVVAWNGYIDGVESRADQRGYDRAVGEHAAKELAAVKNAREEEQRKTAAAQKEAEDARKDLAAMRGTYAGAVDAGQRLRDQLVAARRSCGRAGQPAAAVGSPPADPAADLYADVQRRLEEAENATIRFADESHIAGRACERIYQSVKP